MSTWHKAIIAVHILQCLLLTKFSPPVNLLSTYLHSLISLQTDNNTRSSDVVTLARPSAASSVQITDRSFQYASPHLWNKLPVLLREPVSPLYAYLNPSFSSPLSPSITPSLFHCKLKTYLFVNPFRLRSLTIDTPDWLRRLMGPFSVLNLLFDFTSWFWCGRLN